VARDASGGEPGDAVAGQQLNRRREDVVAKRGCALLWPGHARSYRRTGVNAPPMLGWESDPSVGGVFGSMFRNIDTL
jgi:hypothetical protein